jgi:acyl-CoA thioesterase-1
MKTRSFSLLFILSLACCSLPALAARTVLVFGDSLSAGYGIPLERAWPSLLAQRLATHAPDYTVVNLSVSGETTAGGRTRLPEALRRHRPTVLILELGANDGLRGLPLGAMRANLAAMIDMARTAGCRILLVGMRLPPNYGSYAEQFFATFAQLARQEKVAYLPFLLEAIAGEPRFFQADGLHPTAEAQPLLLDGIWPVLKPLLR